ncbi:MAG: RNA 2',3'-cyclic phosphodiesterase [Coriobacteriales bacterium]
MRLYVAMELPEELRKILADLSSDLQRQIDGRFVDPSLYHVTLAYIGETPDEKVTNVAEIVRKACIGLSPTSASLLGLGRFGKPSNGILVARIDDNGTITNIGNSVRRALSENEISFDPKPIKPHVTLARKVDTRAHRDILEKARQIDSPSATFDVVTLFQSTRVDGALAYLPQQRCTLQGDCEL